MRIDHRRRWETIIGSRGWVGVTVLAEMGMCRTVVISCIVLFSSESYWSVDEVSPGKVKEVDACGDERVEDEDDDGWPEDWTDIARPSRDDMGVMLKEFADDATC